MQIFEYTKFVPNLGALRDDLLGQGFAVDSLAMDEGLPKTYVYVPDTETRETEIGVVVTAHATAGRTHLAVSSDKADDFDGVPKADSDGVATHTITIQKKDVNDNDVTGTEALKVLLSTGATISTTSPTLVGGTITVTVGPSSLPFDVELSVVDPDGKVDSGSLKVRFD